MKRLIPLLLIFILIFSACEKNPPTCIDLYGTYDENDLLIEEFLLTKNDEELKIPQIKGLKKLSVQDKINNEIMEKATELIEKYPHVNYTYFYDFANFANVLSICFRVGFDHEPYGDSVYFNYNLVDGSHLTLEDLFLEGTNILQIVRSSFYKSMALYGNFDDETYVHSPDENAVYKAVTNFMSSKKDFAFSPSEIYFYDGDNMASVKTLDIYDCVGIYSKFLTKESIFTGEYEGYKNVFTCADTNYDLFDVIEYGYAEDNLWYDFTVGENYISSDDPPSDERLEKFNAFREKTINSMRSEIDKARLTATQNPDKFYVLLVKPSVNIDVDSEYFDGDWHYTYYDTATVNLSVQLYEMPIDHYEAVFKDKIIETYRYDYFTMRGGAYFYEEELEGVTLHETDESYTENYMED